jgi:hypothetical protein
MKLIYQNHQNVLQLKVAVCYKPVKDKDYWKKNGKIAKSLELKA